MIKLLATGCLLTDEEYNEYKADHAPEKYKWNPKEYSKEPIATCKSFLGKPNKNCDRGDGYYCYCKLDCSSQSGLDDRKRW